MRLGEQGKRLIEHFEGRRSEVYLDSAGHPTVGIGHLVRPEDELQVGDKVSDEWIDDTLTEDVSDAEKGVLDLVKPSVPLTQLEFDALVSFTFNLGYRALQMSTLLKYLNRGMKSAASDEFVKWVLAGGKVLSGLVRRRHAERALFRGDELVLQALYDQDLGQFLRLTEHIRWPRKEQVEEALS